MYCDAVEHETEFLGPGVGRVVLVELKEGVSLPTAGMLASLC